ncbi:MAG: SIS domain-containing protein, partial [Longicatena sp.]
GTGNEQKSIAQEFKRIFLTVGKCVIDLFDYGEIALMKDGFQKDDVFIIISLSGETKEGIEVMKDMSSHIHTLSITRLQNNTISSMCEMNVYAATQRLDNKQYVSYEMVGVFYALLDMLFMKYLEYKKKMEHGGEENEV